MPSNHPVDNDDDDDNPSSIPTFRSRYSSEEVSHLLLENQLHDDDAATKKFRPPCDRGLVCCLLPKCLCCAIQTLTYLLRTKKRRSVFLTALTAVVLLSMTNLRIDQNSARPLIEKAMKLWHDRSYAMARRESYGLFRTTPSSEWKKERIRVQDQRSWQKLHGIDRKAIPSDQTVAQWYESNWKTEFNCPGKERLGGEEGWYVCNPAALHSSSYLSKKRLVGVRFGENRRDEDTSCLVYTSVRPDGFQLEKELLQRTGKRCEVHAFQPRPASLGEEVPHGVTVHPWGFTSNSQKEGASKASATVVKDGTAEAPNKEAELELKSFQETVQLLNHQGRTIDVFVLDCTGCEWAVYTDWFAADVSIGQLIVKVHGAPSGVADTFFTEVLEKQNYTIFHKEVDRVHGGGAYWFYSFLRVTAEFFVK